MQRISRLVIFTLLVVSTLLAACGAQAGGGSPAVQAVQSYLQALVAKDATKISNLSCAAWESEATLEMDSFQAVTATLDGVSCQETGKNGSATLVNCKGAIVATYNNEKQNLDLSPRTYKVVQEGGEWRVCGYQ